MQQIPEHILQIKDAIRNTKNDAQSKETMKALQYVIHSDLVLLNRQMSELLALDEVILKNLENSRNSLEQEPIIYKKEPSVTPNDSSVVNQGRLGDKKDEMLFHTTTPKKEDAPIRKSSSVNMVLDDLLAPPKLDDILGGEDDPMQQMGNGRKSSSALDHVLNIKEEIITFSSKDEKHSRILDLFSGNKEEKRNSIKVEKRTSISLFDFM